jgi:hypothetical protein
LHRAAHADSTFRRSGLNRPIRKFHPCIPTRANRTKQFVIDGEAVVLGVDGISDFEALYIAASTKALVPIVTVLGGFIRSTNGAWCPTTN